ncbi:curli-like amyloid fiber formation chaperone CsgH [Aquicoccus sp. G2-2]|uniref:curli-like amyloid fiber formation chaperone CsgH n=1 Tax=Aquicoccus sp. G2-2 TaxID=3092120 RepID=UPI002AE04A19|nr:curli-like amyloid fiber formation chaperone CsgH [Aquicoccus sp. G2-2]MEA1112273.1 curli-like amyloid fiber formation chaperone CsgH [Aquicoccus sp. G2-2]
MTNRFIYAALLSSILMAPAFAAAQVAIPTIEITPTTTGVTISGVVAGLSSGTINAEMTITKQDGSSSVNSSQSRQIQVSHDSRDIVATTRLSVGPNAHVHVILKLKENNTVIAQSQTEIGTGD